MDWLFSSYGASVVLQVLTLVHYFRNRPEWYWFFPRISDLTIAR